MIWAHHTPEHTQVQVAYIGVLVAIIVPTVGFFYWFLRRMITRFMDRNTEDHATVRETLKRMEANQGSFKESIQDIREHIVNVHEKLNDHIDNHHREREHS